ATDCWISVEKVGVLLTDQASPRILGNSRLLIGIEKPPAGGLKIGISALKCWSRFSSETVSAQMKLLKPGGLLLQHARHLITNQIGVPPDMRLERFGIHRADRMIDYDGSSASATALNHAAHSLRHAGGQNHFIAMQHCELLRGHNVLAAFGGTEGGYSGKSRCRCNGRKDRPDDGRMHNRFPCAF